AKLDDAKKKLEKEKKKAQKELKDGKSKLDSAEEEYNTKISEAKETLDTAQKEITKGEAEIKSGWASYNKGIEDGEKQISQSKAQLETARETLKTSKTEYNTKIREAEKQLNAAERQYNSGLKEYNEGLSQFKTQTAPAKIAIAALQTKYDTQLNKYENIVKPACEEAVSRAQKNIDEKTAQNEELQSELDNTYGEAQKALINGRIEINNGIIKANQSVIERENKRADEQQSEVEEAKQALDDAKSEFEAQTAEPQAKLDEAKSRLDQAKEQIDSSKAELAEQKAQAEAGFQAAQTQITEGQAALTAAQTELSKQKTEGKQKLLESEEKLQTAKEELEEGKKEFEKQKTEGKNKLEKAKQDYLDGKAQAEKKLDDAQSKIDKAQAKLDDLENPEWYFMTRHDNPGYDSLIDDTTRVDAVAAVFPLFFLLVAALVCLTTLTRHVEEKRTEIGTLKALGYSNREIKDQFIFYAATAAFVGCAVGITAGVFTLPYVIYNAYGIMYELLELKLVVPIGIAVTGVVTAFVCTTLVAVYVCEKTLKEKPSQLMRPKAPKAAKRILLERIGFIWDRMNFTSKVTARNIARYKVRFFMTVVGVAGCTALILTGFGLKDSISSISDKQFGEIYTYDMIAVLDGEGSELEKSEALDFIARDKLVEDAMLQRQIPIKINNGKRSIEDSMYLYVPQSAESMTGFVHLRDRKSGDEIRLGDDGAVLTEKAAATLSVGIGDEITVVDDHRQYRVKISGISENYVNGYLFLSKDYYKQVFGKVPLFNMIMCRMTDSASENQSKLGEKCLDNKSIAAVSFISGGVDTFKDTIKSLDTVILVLIISAGLLAVVVLYNLTNINVAERVREIATIKVLGFYNNETCAFVYRENIILTLGGIAAGLGLGVILHRFVILTIEIDKTMFSRAIEPQSYLYAAVLTAIFAAFVNFIMYFKIKRIDMVESLKSVE
ncbi:MAG: FtsX-like permease family protein, partial [Clostridia bacterium]|nr:FtsX-like permease family protein [Clostridia bacterium]